MVHGILSWIWFTCSHVRMKMLLFSENDILSSDLSSTSDEESPSGILGVDNSVLDTDEDPGKLFWYLLLY